ncbi:zinc finger protein ZAT9-like [Trifolium pratense]|uniref:zinc finger protein ZAT9-like n=1 Tax=Trifolium pratense TaxID=57577 RepID=UPI001E692020|nr:zinc finger protein ZAT9-like [Trifolium pratense]
MLVKRENKKQRVKRNKTKSVQVGVAAMERHKCKLCSRTFGNGRALGGHMKAHLATIKSQKQQFTQFASFSSSSESEHEEEKTLINYVLRENPKKSLKIVDPEFSFLPDQTESVIVQDRESETESKNNPTRQQRSKRNRKHNNNNNNKNFPEGKKSKPSFMMLTAPPPFNDQEPVSSVSDTSPEEDVAMCLMMLSRDKWSREMNINNVVEEEGSVEKTSKLLKRVRGKHLCENCRKSFRSSRALGSHRSVCCRDEAKNGNGKNDDKIFECPFCFKVFGSGQALGGHKRSHLMIPSSSNSTPNVNANANVEANVDVSVRFKESFIDLNLPAPLEEEEDDDDLSVVSEA